jgi:hypothetical protein
MAVGAPASGLSARLKTTCAIRFAESYVVLKRLPGIHRLAWRAATPQTISNRERSALAAQVAN